METSESIFAKNWTSIIYKKPDFLAIIVLALELNMNRKYLIL